MLATFVGIAFLTKDL